MNADEPTHQIAPRTLRVMATVRWVLLALVTMLAAYTIWTQWGPDRERHGAHREARFHCPMHPEIRSPDPGECPICHMTLEPIPDERRDSSAASVAPSDGPANTSVITVSDERQQAVGLVTSPVESATLGDRLRVPGVISAPETGLAQVRVRTAGFVERVAVSQTGVAVKRGQPLAYVYSPEAYRAQEDYVAASRWSASAPAGGPLPNAELTAAARRSLELLGLGAADIDEITRTHQPIRALPIRAPAAGVVTRFNALLGSRADPEMVLYEIADLSKVWVIASVHERDVSSMRVGMEVRFTSANSTQEALTGKVDLIEPILEESTRTARVRIVLANSDGNLRPGQFGEVEFELSGSLGLSVPRDAVIRTGEHEYVYLATGTDRFEPRLVRTGLSREGRVQVLSGLAEGDRVVTRGSFMLDSESRLKASLAASSSAAPPSKPAQSGQPAQPDRPAQPTPPSAPLPMPAGHSH